MKCIKMLVSGFIASVLLSSAVIAAPSTNTPVATSLDASQWTLSLAGAGSTQTTGDNGSVFGGELSLGHTGQLVLPIEVGVRQGFNYDSANTGKNYSFSTRAYLDATVVRLGNLEFDLGVNLGTGYGDVKVNFTAGPEAVVRLYVKKDVDIFGRADYRFNLSSASAENNVGYVVGVRVKF